MMEVSRIRSWNKLLIKFCVVVLLNDMIELSKSNEATCQKICGDAGITFEDDVRSESGMVEVDEGALAVVPCRFTYTGRQSRPFPFWRMDFYDSDYNYERTVFLYPGAFPVNFSYNDSAGGLMISNVDMTLNQTAVRCCFDFFYVNGICEGNRTVINVLPNKQYHYDVATISTPESKDFLVSPISIPSSALVAANSYCYFITVGLVIL